MRLSTFFLKWRQSTQPARLLGLIVVLFTGACSGQPEVTGTVSPADTEPPASITVESSQTPGLTQTYSQESLQTSTPVVYLDTITSSSVPYTWTPVMTFTATPVPSQTQTATAGPSPRPSRTATSTPSPTHTPVPRDAALRISRPGLYSLITSPYKIEAMITRGEDGFVYLSLVGEGQKVLYSQALDYRRSEYNRFLIVPQIEFSLPGVAETARLILETHDNLGRSMALSSVDIILLSIGDIETNPPLHLFEPFLIDYPDDGAVIRGGKLVLGGKAAPLNSSPVIIELVGEDGQVISSRELGIEEPEGSQTHEPFTVELRYTVSEETDARLIIRQESDNEIPGTVALSSVAVTLYP